MIKRILSVVTGNPVFVRIGIFTVKIVYKKIFNPMSKDQKDLIQRLSKRLDDLVKFKNPLLEAFDGRAFKMLLQILFETLWGKIPEDIQDEVLVLLNAFADDDFSRVTDATAGAIAAFVDVPGIGEDDEEKWIALNLEVIFKFILYLKDK